MQQAQALLLRPLRRRQPLDAACRRLDRRQAHAGQIRHRPEVDFFFPRIALPVRFVSVLVVILAGSLPSSLGLYLYG